MSDAESRPVDDEKQAAAATPELVAADKPAEIKATEVKAVNKADTVAAGNPNYVQGSGSLVQRRSRWYSSLAALRYVTSLSRDDDVRVRDSDRATSIFLAISMVLTFLSLVVPQLAQHRVAFILVCDALVGVMLMFYVANRFGILNTLSPRQALLTWQLLMGASFLGIFLTLNLALVVALVVSQQSITIR
jgi:hypothetical protein